MKHGQLIDYNLRNIFLEKSHTKCDREAIARSFSKKPNLSIFNGLKFCRGCYCTPSCELLKY